MTPRKAAVCLDGRRAGTLTEEADGHLVTFAYDAAYEAAPDAVPVSLTLPLGGGPWTTSGLHPFFAGLLPEGWLRTLAVSKLRVDQNDDLGILIETAADCVGAVEIVRETGA